MRRTIMASMVLALTLGVASASDAQQARRGDRDGRGGVAYLLKGIDLTDAQKEQLKALHQNKGPAGVDKSALEKKREEMKAARQRGDTAAVRSMRAQFHEQMKQQHEAMLTSVRGILTPAQREIFEKNLVEGRDRMKERMEKHGKRGERGAGHGSGHGSGHGAGHGAEHGEKKSR